ncbi:MAG: DUF2306 domain-containing protein [Hyphomonadaceae bacterium]
MQDGVTDLFGLEIPSTSPVFLSIVGAHILVGLSAVIFGAVAIFSKKRRGQHSRFGVWYYWAVVATTGTAAVLTVLRFNENLDVMTLGVFCLVAVWFGRTALRRRWPNWVRLHIAGMGLSYVLLLTAFYVENGADLPLWDRLPAIAYWLVPGAIGLPIILFALVFHPVARASH